MKNYLFLPVYLFISIVNFVTLPIAKGSNRGFRESGSAVKVASAACVPLSASPGNVIITWTGEVSSDWDVPCNWSPNWVPDSASHVMILSTPVNQPIITANTVALANTVNVQPGASLTLEATSSLTLKGNRLNASFTNFGTVRNSGKLFIGDTEKIGSLGLFNQSNFVNNVGGEIHIDRFSGSGTAIVNNYGTFTNFSRIVIGSDEESSFEIGMNNIGVFYNNADAEITINRSTRYALLNDTNSQRFFNEGKIEIGSMASVGSSGIYNNSIFVNSTGGEITIDRAVRWQLINDGYGVFNNGAKLSLGTNFNSVVLGILNWSIINNNSGGEIISKKGIDQEGGYPDGNISFNNNACANVTILNGNFVNGSTYTVNNLGFIRVGGQLKNGGIVNNQGLLTYNSSSGVAPTNTSNAAVIINTSEPIFTYGGAFDGTIQGIFTDSTATVSAGTFTPPNSFTPSGILPVGAQKLYAKIAPAGGDCEYVVPFNYQMTALPVSLVTFFGRQVAKNQNSLTWITANEHEFDRFEIQRSPDARSFETVGRVKGTAEGKTSLNSYQFSDFDAVGYNYYRLKMVDRDGTYEFSKIISVENSSKNDVISSLYPNPSGDVVYVDIYAEEDGAWDITVLNLTGAIVYQKPYSLKRGMNKIKLDQLTRGMNLVRFENGKVSEIRKVVRN